MSQTTQTKPDGKGGRGGPGGKGRGPPVYGGGGFYQLPAEPKQEMEMLAGEAKYLKEQLEEINKRITELEKSEKK